MSSFFVTGTDTNVGKTISSRAIIQALQAKNIRIVGYKLIACGQDDPIYVDLQQTQKDDYGTQDNPDVLTLMHSTKEKVSYQDVNSYTFVHTMPMLTTDCEIIDIEKIDRDLKRLTDQYQTVVVEGSFGWLTPMNKTHSFASWVASHQMPVVLVVGIKEGCINHALLSAAAIKQSGLPLLGWIANRVNPGLGHYAEIIQLLSDKIEAPLLGQIPYVHRPEEQELGQYITNVERLTYMQTELVK